MSRAKFAKVWIKLLLGVGRSGKKSVRAETGADTVQFLLEQQQSRKEKQFKQLRFGTFLTKYNEYFLGPRPEFPPNAIKIC